jgi:hypothetical protein
VGFVYGFGAACVRTAEAMVNQTTQPDRNETEPFLEAGDFSNQRLAFLELMRDSNPTLTDKDNAASVAYR